MYNYQKKFRYGFKNYEKEDFSEDYNSHLVMLKYKKAINGTVKVLQNAKYKPYDSFMDLKEQINKLKNDLNEIEADVPIDNELAKKYPGSTGNGDSKFKHSIDNYRKRI